MSTPMTASIKEALVARIDRWLTVFGEPMGNGRANPDNDMIYLLRDCRAALNGGREKGK